MSDGLEDFATERVSEDKTVGGFQIAMINGVLAFAVPGLATGPLIVSAVGFSQAIYAFFLGGIILTIIGVIMGRIGVANRLSSYMLVRRVFGTYGANLVNLALAVSLLGWFGVNMDLFSDAIGRLIHKELGVQISTWVIEIGAGGMMTITTIFGFRLLEKLSSYTVPVLFMITAYLLYRGATTFEGSYTSSLAPEDSMTFGQAVTAVVGGFVVSAVLMSDFTRFARKQSDVITAAALPFLGLATFAYIAAAIAGIATNNDNILDIMLLLGLGSIALLLVFLSTWLTNVVNLYTSSLSFTSIFQNQKRWVLVVIAGIFGTVAASLNILENLTDFLFGLSIIFAPVGGVLAADYYLVQRTKLYALESESSLRPISFIAIFAWGLGVAIPLIATANGLYLTSIEAIDGFICAFIVYGALNIKRVFANQITDDLEKHY